MASSADSKLVVPIVCIECGGNAHCIRRELDDNEPVREHRTFECAMCDRLSDSVVYVSPSDAAAQKDAERARK